MTVAVGPALGQTIKIAFTANQPVLLRGSTGVGKSESLRQAAESLAIECIVRDLSIMEPSDLTGMPAIQDGLTTFSPPAWLPTSGKGLLLFEELNRAPEYMRAPTLELLTSRKLNDYQLPPGWLPMAAINPDDGDGYVGTRQMDLALLARFMTIDVEPSVRDWAVWANQNTVDARVVSFVETVPKVFNGGLSNPRAWTNLSRILQALEGETWNAEIAQNCFTGLVGEDMAVAFMGHLRGVKKNLRIPTPEDIITSYKRHRRSVKQLSTKGDTASLTALVHHMLMYLQDPDSVNHPDDDPQYASNLETFISDLPAEHRRKMREFLEEDNAA